MPKQWVVSAEAPQGDVLREVASIVRAGGVIAYPTDTLYGLGVDPWHPDAVHRLFEIKGRAARQAVPLIASTEQQVIDSLGALGETGARLARAFWPGPLTLVVRAPADLPALLLGGGTTVGVRVPAHAVARGLATCLGRPITATSANRSGESATALSEDVLNTLGDRLDGIIAGVSPGGPPSTIVDVAGNTPRLVREGAIPWDRVVQFLAS